MMCPRCNSQELKLIPAGISKRTGKPYNEFLSCSNCKYIINSGGEKKQTPTVKEQIASSQIDKQNDNKWENISLGKCRHAYGVEAFKMGWELTPENIAILKAWTEFSMYGKVVSGNVIKNNNQDNDLVDLTQIPF